QRLKGHGKDRPEKSDLSAGRLWPNDSARRHRAVVGEIVERNMGCSPAPARHAERRRKYHAAVNQDRCRLRWVSEIWTTWNAVIGGQSLAVSSVSIETGAAQLERLAYRPSNPRVSARQRHSGIV